MMRLANSNNCNKKKPVGIDRFFLFLKVNGTNGQQGEIRAITVLDYFVGAYRNQM